MGGYPGGENGSCPIRKRPETAIKLADRRYAGLGMAGEGLLPISVSFAVFIFREFSSAQR